MGYQRKTYTIKWPEGHVHHGLEVKLRGLSGADLLKVSSLRNRASENVNGLEEVGEAIDIMAGRILSWNLEDDGVPIPPTAENIRGEDFGMVMDILNSWVKAVSSVPAPLGAPSNSGGEFPEVSIPMETL